MNNESKLLEGHTHFPDHEGFIRIRQLSFYYLSMNPASSGVFLEGPCIEP